MEIRKIIVITALILNAVLSFGQSKISLRLDEWPEEQILKARKTADTHIKCTKNEKEVIFYSNLVRINGPLFERTVLNQYLNETGYTEKGGYVQSLREDLKKLTVDKLPMLAYDDRLYLTSRKFAVEGGKKGTIGHEGFDERLQHFSKTNYCVAENCSYGLMDPLESFMMLLIDEGVAGVGHRKNLLNSSFEFGSAAFAFHRTYRVNMVMNFACGRMTE